MVSRYPVPDVRALYGYWENHRVCPSCGRLVNSPYQLIRPDPFAPTDHCCFNGCQLCFREFQAEPRKEVEATDGLSH